MKTFLDPMFESYEEEQQDTIYEQLIRESRIQPRRGAES